MVDKKKEYSIALFPFLKSDGSTRLGTIVFRSTEDIDNLPPEQASSVQQVARMLFLRDNFRIHSASYAIIPFVDLTHMPVGVDYLINIQAFVSYLYASPRHEFGDLFFPSEYCSMVIFTPGKVLASLIQPSYHVQPVGHTEAFSPDNRGEVDGFVGLYNFRHHFWVAEGSRIYGPKPNILLNQSQVLNSDVDRAGEARIDYQLLDRLLSKPATEPSSRMFTALRWFNFANDGSQDQSGALVNLSIAFEALLGLPAEDKTDRLVDTISMLLGRTRRLDIWARQFYNARSRVVHEGRVEQLRFVATDSRKSSESPLYQSLLSYGRQIFQLCLGTLLVGADLAETAGLEQKLLTNQERFQEMCKILSNEAIECRERIERIEPIVATIDRYRYVPESDLKIETMIGVTRLAAKALMEADSSLPKDLADSFELLISASKDKDHLPELEALEKIEKSLSGRPIFNRPDLTHIVKSLVKVVWDYVSMHYFWLKKRSP